jgi:nicotinate-nucleotide adenylyltransferase
MTERIAVCGGTFDPFHCGHIEPVRSIRETFGWDTVLYMPAFVQPFKRDRLTQSPFHRHAMTVLGTEDDLWAMVSTLELDRSDVSYTVDTLQWLRSRHPAATIDWIIGDDNLGDLKRWKNLPGLLELANFAVLRRGGTLPLDADLIRLRCQPGERGRAGAIVFAGNDVVALSSTEIRERIRTGKSIDGMVPPRVARYIRRNGLYLEGPGTLED